MLYPAKTSAVSTSGMEDVISETFFASSSVWLSALPSGRDIDSMMIPWSSSGTREVGSVTAIRAVAPRKSRKTTKTTTPCLSITRTEDEKPCVRRSKKELNHLNKINFGLWSEGFRIIAQSAGVSESATKPEIMTEVAIVTANCL